MVFVYQSDKYSQNINILSVFPIFTVGPKLLNPRTIIVSLKRTPYSLNPNSYFRKVAQAFVPLLPSALTSGKAKPYKPSSLTYHDTAPFPLAARVFALKTRAVKARESKADGDAAVGGVEARALP